MMTNSTKGMNISKLLAALIKERDRIDEAIRITPDQTEAAQNAYESRQAAAQIQAALHRLMQSISAMWRDPQRCSTSNRDAVQQKAGRAVNSQFDMARHLIQAQ